MFLTIFFIFFKLLRLEMFCTTSKFHHILREKHQCIRNVCMQSSYYHLCLPSLDVWKVFEPKSTVCTTCFHTAILTKSTISHRVNDWMIFSEILNFNSSLRASFNCKRRRSASVPVTTRRKCFISLLVYTLLIRFVRTYILRTFVL